MANQLPTTVAEAIQHLLSLLDEENRAALKAIPRNRLIQLHHGYGTGIRNSLGLWGQNKALRSDPEIAHMHPDDASIYIIEQMWDFLHAQDGDTAE
jgi:hypothetical protein